MSINRKQVIKNAWRITKNRDTSTLRVRVPGGHLETQYFDLIRQIADDYGNGSVHITARQGFEIPDIPWEKRPEVNALIAPLIDMLDLKVPTTADGYPAAGTRNVSACIGNRVCPFANDDTTRIAQRLERETFPHDLHFKIAVTGCPNDCIKAQMNDFGIICLTEPMYDPSRCISCNACAENCEKKVTGALVMKNFNIERDHEKCIGCGECVLKCPTRAMTRNPKKLYRMVIMGRTGKKNPRLAETFIQWATEDVLVQIIKNTYGFVERYIDRGQAKEHIGYIVDRQGFHKFKAEVMEGVVLNPEAKVADNIQWGGYWYKQGMNLK